MGTSRIQLQGLARGLCASSQACSHTADKLGHGRREIRHPRAVIATSPMPTSPMQGCFELTQSAAQLVNILTDPSYDRGSCRRLP